MREITIQGIAHPIHFGLRALCDFTKTQDTDFDTTVTSAQALGSLDSIVGLTVTGLNEGARRTNSAATQRTRSGISLTMSRS